MEEFVGFFTDLRGVRFACLAVTSQLIVVACSMVLVQ